MSDAHSVFYGLAIYCIIFLNLKTKCDRQKPIVDLESKSKKNKLIKIITIIKNKYTQQRKLTQF